MAEFTAFRNNVLDGPIYGLPYVIGVTLLDANGDPVSPSSPDSEISKNGDTAADCTNELVEISGITGGCYLSLTATELTCEMAHVECSSTGAKTTQLTLYPKKLVTVRTGTSASAGSLTNAIVLDGSASPVDDFYNGMIVAAVIDGTTEVRMITDYVGSTQTASVVPDWNTAPDNNDTFTIYRPDGVQIQQSDLQAVLGILVPTAYGRSVTKSIGTGVCDAGGTTTSVVSSSCTPAGGVADQFKGRILIFTNDTTTAALRGQATDITASSNSATPTFTVSALTTAPASGDVFVIV